MGGLSLSYSYSASLHETGAERTSGLEWSLASWKSKDDPGTGDFWLKIDLTGSPQFFLFNNSERIWRAGPWNGINQVAEESTFNYTANYVDNDDEISYFYTVHDPTVIFMLTVTETGNVERRTWLQDQRKWIKLISLPRDQCDYYSHCGSFSNCRSYRVGEFECGCLLGYEPKVKSEWYLRDGTNGCTRKPGEPSCENSSSSTSSANAGFIKLTFAKLPDTENAVVNKNLGLKECGDLCLKNCSCTAYSSAYNGNGCITWYGDLIDLRQYPNGGQDVFIKVSESEQGQYSKINSNGSNTKKLINILAPSMAGVLILMLVFAIRLALWRRKGKRQSLKNIFPGFNLDSEPSYGGTPRTDEIDKNGDFSVFDLKTIISATNCFDVANKLGEGGFGSVYKGEMNNGKEVAIKRLSKTSGQGMEEFKNEVTLIARLQHRNLVKLLGCCVQQEEKILVYEYLPNKGLDNFIFGKEKKVFLDWKKRLEIILGIARGILYLHRDSRLRIIHRDLKANNVLLDANMEPKISDFGMARIFNADQVEAKTRRVVGTYGYMSPEYVMRGLFSEKSDVFSYGVLLLEIISGRRNNSPFGDSTMNLTGYVWELWKEGNAMDLIDPAMGDSYNHDEVVRCIHIGLLCVQEHAEDRPTMSEVISMLCSETTSNPLAPPKQPAFVTKRVDNRNNHPYLSSDLRAFVANMTITVLQAR